MQKNKKEIPTSEKLKAAAFENMGMAICITDEVGNFVEVNQSYIDLYGYTREELIGNHFTMVVPSHYHEQAKRIHDAFMAGMPEIPAEWIVMRKDGEYRNIFVVSTLLIREGIKCKVSSIADITEYKRYQFNLKAHGGRVSS